jgi:4-amino-4-deoxy-L-arabinose transferase-like glycosyltransferase
LLVLLAISLYIVAMLPSLTRFPPLNNDEGREANLSWVAAGLQPGAERMNAYRGSPNWGTGGLQGATTVVLFHLFGPGVLQARLTSLIWGGLLLMAVYWLGREYWGRAVGLAATVLLAVSEPFLVGTHTLRPDIQVVTLALLGLLLVERGLRLERSWPVLLGGVSLGLAFDTHMNTAGLMPLVAAAPLVRHGARVLKRPTLWLLALGLSLGLLYYALVRVLPDPAAYFTALSYWIGVDKAPPVLREAGGGGLLTNLEQEWLRYADYFGLSTQTIEEPGELALVLFGLGLGTWRALRGSAPDRILLLGLLMLQLFFVVAVSTKSRYYMLLTYPLYALLIARGLQQVASPVRRPPIANWGFAALVALAVIWPLKFEDRAWDKYVWAERYREGQEHYALIARLEQLAGPEARILAPPRYWFGLHTHPFTDIFVFERVRRQFEESPAQFLDAVRPDFVITDGKIATDKTVERELHRALGERAPYEMVLRHKNYGDIGIYRLKWD